MFHLKTTQMEPSGKLKCLKWSSPQRQVRCPKAGKQQQDPEGHHDGSLSLLSELEDSPHWPDQRHNSNFLNLWASCLASFAQVCDKREPRRTRRGDITIMTCL